VITPPPTPPGIGRHHWQQPLPFRICQVMTTQAIIHSATSLEMVYEMATSRPISI
jgi:hypothetical protein